MKQAFRLFIIVAIVSHPVMVFSYEQPTHVKLSEQATKASVLGKLDEKVLISLGLKPSIEDPSQVFPNAKNNPRRIIDLVTDGADFEDSDSRSINHFYDPVHNVPLSVPLIPTYMSPDWALDDKADINGQEFSYKRAKQYLYDALTKGTKDERDKNFGLTFQTLGQVIHHIQDMAQPPHTRNVFPIPAAHGKRSLA